MIMAKFNAVLVSVFLIGQLLVGFTSHNLLHNNARIEVVIHARMMMEEDLSIRGYTVCEIKPLLATQLERKFLLQSVPT